MKRDQGVLLVLGKILCRSVVLPLQFILNLMSFCLQFSVLNVIEGLLLVIAMFVQQNCENVRFDIRCFSEQCLSE